MCLRLMHERDETGVDVGVVNGKLYTTSRSEEAGQPVRGEVITEDGCVNQ